MACFTAWMSSYEHPWLRECRSMWEWIQSVVFAHGRRAVTVDVADAPFCKCSNLQVVLPSNLSQNDAMRDIGVLTKMTEALILP